MTQGYVHIYTGKGKGKTTTAIGLAISSLGWGKSSFIIQFMKGQPCGEMKFILSLNNPLITLEQYGCPDFFYPDDRSQFALHREKALAGLKRAEEIIGQGKYDILILDEILNAIHYGLIDESSIEEILLSKPQEMELILTGRFASEKIIAMADLVSEIEEIKHYYNKGIDARKGIEF